MINPQWLELPMSQTNFHCPKDVRAIEVRLYLLKDISEDTKEMPQARSTDLQKRIATEETPQNGQ